MSPWGGSMSPWGDLCHPGGIYVTLEGSMSPWGDLCHPGGVSVTLGGSMLPYVTLRDLAECAWYSSPLGHHPSSHGHASPFAKLARSSQWGNTRSWATSLWAILLVPQTMTFHFEGVLSIDSLLCDNHKQTSLPYSPHMLRYFCSHIVWKKHTASKQVNTSKLTMIVHLFELQPFLILSAVFK